MDCQHPLPKPATKKAPLPLRGSCRQLHCEQGSHMLFGCAGPLAEATERSSTLAAHCDSFRRRTNSGRTPQERRDLALHLLFKTEDGEEASVETSQHLGDTGTFALTRGDDTDTHPALRTKLRRASMPSPDPVLNNNTFARPASVPSPEDGESRSRVRGTSAARSLERNGYSISRTFSAQFTRTLSRTGKAPPILPGSHLTRLEELLCDGDSSG
mmetsp:Transcript_55274/g.130735  ORF Transcript_55274/g.130735 Transcript_55274/m.130735 type:complete len:214 (+) Transcript_55274:70-711(+)